MNKLESVSQVAGYNVPVENVTLPSQGAIYNSEHPLCNAESIEIRCMCARDEDLLTSRALIKKGTVITELLKACLMNKTIDPDKLITGDRNAILIALRVSGYGPEYGVRVSCPDCDEEQDYTFSLGSLAIKRLGAQPSSPNTNEFSFTLPLSKMEVKFKLLTGEDDREISSIAEKRKKMGVSLHENLITTRLFHSIISLNGETDKGKIANMVSYMKAGDSLAFRRHIDKIEPGVDMKQKMVCKSCGGESEVDVPIGASFFWPDLA